MPFASFRIPLLHWWCRHRGAAAVSHARRLAQLNPGRAALSVFLSGVPDCLESRPPLRPGGLMNRDPVESGRERAGKFRIRLEITLFQRLVLTEALSDHCMLRTAQPARFVASHDAPAQFALHIKPLA